MKRNNSNKSVRFLLLSILSVFILHSCDFKEMIIEDLENPDPIRFDCIEDYKFGHYFKDASYSFETFDFVDAFNNTRSSLDGLVTYHFNTDRTIDINIRLDCSKIPDHGFFQTDLPDSGIVDIYRKVTWNCTNDISGKNEGLFSQYIYYEVMTGFCNTETIEATGVDSLNIGFSLDYWIGCKVFYNKKKTARTKRIINTSIRLGPVGWIEITVDELL